MVRLEGVQTPAQRGRATGSEDTCGTRVKDREAWPGLRKPLYGRRRGVKAGPEVRLGTMGLGLPLLAWVLRSLSS